MLDEIKTLYLDKKRTIKEVADELDLSFWKVYNLMRRNNICRRGYSEANYVKYDRYKPRFLIKRIDGVRNESLKIAGTMLYWAEGAKGGYTVDFANSDPHMIRIFLRFLREICGINEKRLRVYLYAFSDQKVSEIMRYWSKIIQVPISNFTKPYIKKADPRLKNRRMPHGLIHLRYNDKRLLIQINNWLKQYVEYFNKRGDAGVVKRTRL